MSDFQLFVLDRLDAGLQVGVVAASLLLFMVAIGVTLSIGRR